jgi:hypothetical protein
MTVWVIDFVKKAVHVADNNCDVDALNSDYNGAVDPVDSVVAPSR